MKTYLFALLTIVASYGCKSTAMLANNNQVDAIMKNYNTADQPGASVLVLQDQKIIFKKGYGVENIITQKTISPSTNFRLASVTKQFTAMAILLLQQQNKLSIEDPLTKYFSSFPAYGKEIKIKHLLTHSSGLQDYEDLMPSSQTQQLHDTSCLQLMYTTNKLYFPAGTQYKYSNTGYAILALIIEKVSGQDYATFMNEKIFKPIGMKTTIAYESGKSFVVNRASGHSFKNGNWIETDQNLTSAVLGDGGIYSNSEDLSKWIKALWNFKLVPPAIQNKAWSNTILENGRIIDYGYGWHVEAYKNSTHPFHDGSSIGFRNSIQVFPNQKLMVVVLTNRNERDPAIEAKKIADLFLK